MKWTYPKTTRVVIVQTDDAQFLQAGCRPIQAMPAAQWRVCQASMRPQGYRVVCQFRVPMRRLAPGWGWWGFACQLIERLGFDHHGRRLRYWKGDAAAYTGKNERIAGALMYELILLEGHRKDDSVWTSRPPAKVWWRKVSLAGEEVTV